MENTAVTRLSPSPIILFETADDLRIVEAHVGILYLIRLAVLEHILQGSGLLGRVYYHVLVERFRRHILTAMLYQLGVYNIQPVLHTKYNYKRRLKPN